MAKKINISRPHTLGLEAATTKLSELVGQLKAKYGVETAVKGSSAQVSGKGVKGNVQVTATHVNVALELGLPASLIAAKVEEGIHKSIDKHFGGAAS